jgi:hypothetical protein
MPHLSIDSTIRGWRTLCTIPDWKGFLTEDTPLEKKGGFMKRIILSAALVAAVAASGLAQDKPTNPNNPQDRPSTSQDKHSTSAKTMRGTVSSVDQSGKSFVIKDEATGKEMTVYWDGSTKVTGDLKAGSMVSFQASDSSGRWMASSIDVSSAKKPY